MGIDLIHVISLCSFGVSLDLPAWFGIVDLGFMDLVCYAFAAVVTVFLDWYLSLHFYFLGCSVAWKVSWEWKSRSHLINFSIFFYCCCIGGLWLMGFTWSRDNALELLQRYRRDRRVLLSFILSGSLVKKVILPPGAVSLEDVDIDQVSIDYVLNCVKKGNSMSLLHK